MLNKRQNDLEKEEQEDQFSEISTNLSWLASNMWPNKELDVECLIPKLSDYLLPLHTLTRQRARISRLSLHSVIESGLWYCWSELFRIRLKNRIWPTTMEVDVNRWVEVESRTLESLRGGYGVVISMASYSNVAVNLAHGLRECGVPYFIMLPLELYDRIGPKFPESAKVLPIESFGSSESRASFDILSQKALTCFDDLAEKIQAEGSWLLQTTLDCCRDQLSYVISNIFPQLMFYQSIARKAFDIMQPKAFLVARLKRITENVYAREARNRRIPVFLVNHGYLRSDWDASDLGQVDEICSAVFAWNEDQAKTWRSIFPELGNERIRVVGGAQWDTPIKTYGRKSNKEIMTMRKRFADLVLRIGDNVGDLTGTWLTITIDDNLKPYLSDIITIASEYGIRCFVKMRPGETIEDYSILNYQNAAPQVVFISDEHQVDLHELLYISDLVAVCISTVGFDSLAVGTPVLTLALNAEIRSDERTCYLRQLGLPETDNLSELKSVLNSWSVDFSMRESWQSQALQAARQIFANYPNGDAVTRIVQAVENVHTTGDIRGA